MPIAEVPPAPPLVESSAAVDFDLGQMAGQGDGAAFHAVRPRCPAGRVGEIVVCAPDVEKDRLRPLSGDYATPEGLPRAEMGIGSNAALGTSIVSAPMAGGVVSNRVMVDLKFKF